MNFKQNMQNIAAKNGETFRKLAIQLQKASPDIFMVLGIGGLIGGTVLACIATINAKEKIEESQKTVEILDHTFDVLKGNYSKEDHDHDVLVVNAKTVGEVAMMYAPAVGLHILSISAILASHNIMKERNLGLVAALATVSQGFQDYRKGVTEKYGKEVDDQIRNHTETKTFEETTIDENGKTKKVKKKVDVSTLPFGSPYAKFFDAGCNGWCDDPEYNKAFLIMQQGQATDKLRAEGYLFLNDVYEMLGIPRTREGQIVGWIYRKDIPTPNDYVDFGIFKTNRENNVNFVNGYEPTIILDFNVYGPIIDLI